MSNDRMRSRQSNARKAAAIKADPEALAAARAAQRCYLAARRAGQKTKGMPGYHTAGYAVLVSKFVAKYGVI